MNRLPDLRPDNPAAIVAWAVAAALLPTALFVWLLLRGAANEELALRDRLVTAYQAQVAGLPEPTTSAALVLAEPAPPPARPLPRFPAANQPLPLVDLPEVAAAALRVPSAAAPANAQERLWRLRAFWQTELAAAPVEQWHRLPTSLGPIYFRRPAEASAPPLAAWPKAWLATVVDHYGQTLPPELVGYVRASDGSAQWSAPPPVGMVDWTQAGAHFLFAAPIPAHPNWELRLYLRDAGVLTAAAQRQAMSYWLVGGSLLLTVALVVGLAVRSLTRQMHLNKLRNDFIGTVSHELKTPLASQRLLLDTLLEGRLTDPTRQREYLELLARENLRLTRLVENFLGFSRMERGQAQLRLEPQDPGALARYAVEALQTRLQPPAVRFTLAVGADLPRVQADPDAFVTVLLNLLENALKYTRDDDKEIALTVKQEGSRIAFAVRDNGIGIPRRLHRKVFDRFFQVDNSLSRRAEGAGLGLAIVAYIVAGHGGTVEVASEPGQGSTFTVRLPAL